MPFLPPNQQCQSTEGKITEYRLLSKCYRMLCIWRGSGVVMLSVLLADYDAGAWGSTLVDPLSRRHARTSGSLSELGTLKRFPGRPRTERALYNMAAMMASIGAGFDVRISNSTAFHPSGALSLANLESVKDCRLKLEKSFFKNFLALTSACIIFSHLNVALKSCTTSQNTFLFHTPEPKDDESFYVQLFNF